MVWFHSLNLLGTLIPQKLDSPIWFRRFIPCTWIESPYENWKYRSIVSFFPFRIPTAAFAVDVPCTVPSAEAGSYLQTMGLEIIDSSPEPD